MTELEFPDFRNLAQESIPFIAAFRCPPFTVLFKYFLGRGVIINTYLRK